jgi:pyruvate dehydrogenase E1 component alpha subunit
VKVYLARTGEADADFFAAVEEEADKLGHRMREECRAMPDPAPLSAFDNVYAEPSAIIEAERAQYAAYLDSFDGQEAGR